MTSEGPETTLDSYPDGFSEESRGGGKKKGAQIRQRVGSKGEWCVQKRGKGSWGGKETGTQLKTW